MKRTFLNQLLYELEILTYVVKNQQGFFLSLESNWRISDLVYSNTLSKFRNFVYDQDNPEFSLIRLAWRLFSRGEIWPQADHALSGEIKKTFQKTDLRNQKCLLCEDCCEH